MSGDAPRAPGDDDPGDGDPGDGDPGDGDPGGGDEAERERVGPPTAPHRTWLRRLAPLVLLGVGALFFRRFSAISADEREVVLELDRPATITAVALEWSPVDEAGVRGEPETGQAFRFDLGKAPSLVPTRVRLRDSIYEVRAQVESNGTTRESTQRIEVSRASRITLPLR